MYNVGSETRYHYYAIQLDIVTAQYLIKLYKLCKYCGLRNTSLGKEAGQ